MRTITTSRASRTIGRVRRLWAELDYAQRRLLEIQTGIPIAAPEDRSTTRGQID
jgi:hypothetical protein